MYSLKQALKKHNIKCKIKKRSKLSNNIYTFSEYFKNIDIYYIYANNFVVDILINIKSTNKIIWYNIIKNNNIEILENLNSDFSDIKLNCNDKILEISNNIKNFYQNLEIVSKFIFLIDEINKFFSNKFIITMVAPHNSSKKKAIKIIDNKINITKNRLIDIFNNIILKKYFFENAKSNFLAQKVFNNFNNKVDFNSNKENKIIQAFYFSNFDINQVHNIDINKLVYFNLYLSYESLSLSKLKNFFLNLENGFIDFNNFNNKILTFIESNLLFSILKSYLFLIKIF
jgi:hypothetical protein